jgi:hypothetical protein
MGKGRWSSLKQLPALAVILWTDAVDRNNNKKLFSYLHKTTRVSVDTYNRNSRTSRQYYIDMIVLDITWIGLSLLIYIQCTGLRSFPYMVWGVTFSVFLFFSRTRRRAAYLYIKREKGGPITARAPQLGPRWGLQMGSFPFQLTFGTYISNV